MARQSIYITSILLLSFLAIASAYESVEKPEALPTKPVYKQPNPEEVEKPETVPTKPVYTQPNPEEHEDLHFEKPSYYKKPTYPVNLPKYKPEEDEDLHYKRPSYYKKPTYPIDLPKYRHEEDEDVHYERPSYYKKPTYPINLPKYRHEEDEDVHYERPSYYKKPTYPINLPKYKQPEAEEKEEYVPNKPSYYKAQPQPKYPINPKYYQPKPKPKYEAPRTVVVQGAIYCKSGPKYSPLPGAVAKIVCVSEHVQSYESSEYSVLSQPCDAKGYFYATLQLKDQWKVKNCKAYLYSSPSKSCNVPTNVNNGVTGYSFTPKHYGILPHHNNAKIYSVGTFFYTTPVPKPTYYTKPVPKPYGKGY